MRAALISALYPLYGKSPARCYDQTLFDVTASSLPPLQAPLVRQSAQKSQRGLALGQRMHYNIEKQQKEKSLKGKYLQQGFKTRQYTKDRNLNNIRIGLTGYEN